VSRPLRLLFLAGLVILAFVLAACGSSSSSGSAATTGFNRPGGRGAIFSAKVRACLKQHGVTIARGSRGGGPPGANGAPPSTNGTPPSTNGTPPRRNGQGGRRPRGGFGRNPKFRAAMQACGVKFPGGGGPGGGPGAPQGQTLPQS
jgi:hypothetical protein